MKLVSILSTILTLLSVHAQAGEKVYTGEDAKAIMRTLTLLSSETSLKADSGESYIGGGNIDGFGNEDVSDHWSYMFAKIGHTSIVCETHEYQKNKDSYDPKKNRVECRTR